MDKEYGFKINKIVVTGSTKKDAFLDFNSGLNVISGASDTGKTFIFETLDYIFGGKNKPKKIKEAKDYDEIFVELESCKNTYTLKRNINTKKVFLYNCKYDNISIEVPVNLNQRGKNSISTFLLKLCNCKYEKVIRNKNGEVSSFTFRNFARITMLNEEKIITKNSIILSSAGPVNDTSSKNSFKTIITGLEDNNIQLNHENKLNNVKINGQIEMLDELIKNYNEELCHIELCNKKEDIADIQCLIDDIKQIVYSKKNDLKEADEEIQKLTGVYSDNENKIIYNNELIKKFTLLKKNYLSDLERIEFIDDANYYINQLNNVKCPVCFSNTDKIKIDVNSISEGIYAEKNKLQKKILELNQIIKERKLKHIELIDLKEDTSDKIDELTKKMNTVLKPLIELKINELESLLTRRDVINKIEFIKNELRETNKLKIKLLEEKEKNDINITETNLNKIDNKIIEELSLEVSTLLSEWKLFSKPFVEFNLQTNDLIIDGKNKESFGKGYRAIINSALSIAIMNYCISHELPHPKIIILDSPLITFKEKDKDKEKINDNVKTSFYSYLAENFKEKQIIIFENAEPDKGLCDKIKYYHFTKNYQYGRYGFF